MAMRYPATTFQSLKVALKEIEPIVKENSQHLATGRPLTKLGDMRSRELLTNWLLCATAQAIENREMMLFSDPVGGDGIIQDVAADRTWAATEHVYVPRHEGGQGADPNALILDRINKKRTKGGAAYASDKTLVVFVDATTRAWVPTYIARKLPKPLHFAAVWVISLQTVKDGAYSYGLTRLEIIDGKAPVFMVRISKDFDAWEVMKIQ